MPDLKGSKTEKNLMEAFAGESMARNKYTYFAGKAKKDGYEQIAAIFEETANNEKEHAKIWFKLLCGGEIPSTDSNLEAAAAGETKNGQRCTNAWLKRLKQRASTILLSCLNLSGTLKKSMKKDILHSLAM